MDHFPTDLDMDEDFPPKEIDQPFDDDDENDDDISIAKIKSQLGFADDEVGTFLGLPKEERPGKTISFVILIQVLLDLENLHFSSKKYLFIN